MSVTLGVTDQNHFCDGTILYLSKIRLKCANFYSISHTLKCIQNTSSRDAIISKLSIHVIHFWMHLCDVKIIIKVCMLESDFGQLQNTVEPLLTHTFRWIAQGMPYEGLCVQRGMLKIDSKNHQKIRKNQKKINLHIRAKLWYINEHRLALIIICKIASIMSENDQLKHHL